MTFLDVDSDLIPISESAPCGEALDYDLDFLEFEGLAQRGIAPQTGDAAASGDQIDWTKVSQAATSLGKRTKDLRIAVIAARAALNRGGYKGLCEGLTVIAGYVERFWNQVHPLPDPDDAEDQTVRLNAIANLCDPEEFLSDLRKVRITQSRRFGTFCYRDYIESQRQAAAPVADAVSPSADGDAETSTQTNIDSKQIKIDAAFAETPADAIDDASASLDGCLMQMMRLERALRTQTGSDQSILLAPLSGLLRQIKQWIDRYRTVSAEIATDPSSTAASAGPAIGEFRDRSEIVSMLDKICRWLRSHEPASPVPPLLERAMRLIAMDFLSLLLELAPDGAAQFRALAGIAASTANPAAMGGRNGK